MYHRTLILATALFALLIVAVGHAQPARPTAGARTTIYAPLIRQPAASSSSVQNAEQQAIAQKVLDLVNIERAKANPPCPPVTINESLTKAAQGHSQDMAVANFFAHANLGGVGPGDRARATGFTGLVGENIAAGYSTANAVMNSWMTSTLGHRENILNCNYREIGIGYYYQVNDQNNIFIGTSSQGSPLYGGPCYTYWVQDLGRP